MKIFMRILLLLVVLLIASLIFGYFKMNSAIKMGVEKWGPEMTQSTVTLGAIKLSPFTTQGSFNDLVIGNPEGYKTDSAIKIGSVEIELDKESLMTDQIIVNKVHINSPEITYEKGLKGSNIDQLIKNIEEFANKNKEEVTETEPTEDEASEDENAEPKKKVKVLIKELKIIDAKVRPTLKVLQGIAPTLTIPEITMTDIGKDDEEASIAKIFSTVLKKVLGSVTGVVTGSAALVGDAVKGTAGVVADGAEEVTEAAGEAVGAVTDGAKEVTDSVKDAVGGLKSIFGSEKDK